MQRDYEYEYFHTIMDVVSLIHRAGLDTVLSDIIERYKYEVQDKEQKIKSAPFQFSDIPF